MELGSSQTQECVRPAATEQPPVECWIAAFG